MSTGDRIVETITLSQAKSLIRSMSHEQSLLLLSAPGVGKSDAVHQAASDAGLECRSLLGTQIAPEDVSGIPRIVGKRSVFCPPRILLPENPTPFCLFLDELPASTPDIQKAFYSVLLERRVGEHQLPKGTWVVAAGNRVEDRALVRTISSALINRVVILNVRVDIREWLVWAKENQLRAEIMSFLTFLPRALMRDVPREPIPFSTPRAWASLSQALDLVEAAGELNGDLRRALAFGRVSAEDAAVFCAVSEEGIGELEPVLNYIEHPERMPENDTACWFLLSRIRAMVQANELNDVSPEQMNSFLTALPEEHRFALLVDMVETWAKLGATQAMFDSLKQVTGLGE